ncbi:MAG: GGDEF domain-containing protein [Gammaproteobacteria bacterium]|nr:GGDEF domain-containing protein [Gammaproteobacteria bacterium]
MMKKILTLTFYLVYLSGAIFSFQILSHIPERYLPILEVLPFGLLIASIVLGIKFNRSQLIYSALLFSLIYSFFFWFVDFKPSQITLILNSLTLLLSVNIVLICLYSERGIFTLIGLSRLFIIGFQVVFMIWLIHENPPQWSLWLNQILFPELQIKLLFFNQISLLSILICFFILSLLSIYQNNSFLGAILASWILVLYAITFAIKDIVFIANLFSFSLILLLITLISVSYQMAYLDELTGLPGRRALNEALNKLGNKYVLAMLDVDHFKKFNDTYGHDAGDDVLRLLGHRLSAVKGGGKPFRYGGEEFTLVFSGKSLDDVASHLEALRENVANKKFTLRKQERRQKGKRKSKKATQREVKVTISIGYAERSDKAKNHGTVLKMADKALYKAKKKGRNCISK